MIHFLSNSKFPFLGGTNSFNFWVLLLVLPLGTDVCSCWTKELHHLNHWDSDNDNHHGILLPGEWLYRGKQAFFMSGKNGRVFFKGIKGELDGFVWGAGEHAKFSRLYLKKTMFFSLENEWECCCFWRCSSCFAKVSAKKPCIVIRSYLWIHNYIMIMLFLLLMNRSMIPPSNQIFYWIINTKNMTKNTFRLRFPLRG